MPNTCSYRWRQALGPQKKKKDVWNLKKEKKKKKKEMKGGRKKKQTYFSMQNCMEAKRRNTDCLIFVSDKNILTGEALEMWEVV